MSKNMLIYAKNLYIDFMKHLGLSEYYLSYLLIENIIISMVYYK